MTDFWTTDKRLRKALDDIHRQLVCHCGCYRHHGLDWMPEGSGEGLAEAMGILRDLLDEGTGTTCKTTKGYPRCTSGPLRHKYIHRIVAAALIGRELERSEEVHHKDGDRRNFNWDNLLVLGQKDHGWVSAKQAWYMKEIDVKLKTEWEDFMKSEEKRFDAEVRACKADGRAYGVEDGTMKERFEGGRLGIPSTST